MRRSVIAKAILALLITLPAVAAAADPATLSLRLRKRVETQPGSGQFRTVVQPAHWEARKTAIIVCDMWDLHHCLNATRRVAEMAPHMNRLLTDARQRGVLIIHAPSSCMDAYKDHPARQNALKTPRAAHLPHDIASWCNRIPAEEKGVYPIDQTDGGEDDDLAEHRAWADKFQKMGRNPRAPWKSQIDTLKIDDRDVISDGGEEIWSVLTERGIDNIILLGVHTNMCVLGRPFGLRQMAKNGKNVVLMRDLTDTMYNPSRAPKVSHFTGTDLIVEHVEKWVCPTITSDQLLGGKPFHFSGDKRPHLVLVLAEPEYQTERTLPEFARKHLGKTFRVSEVYGEKNANDIPGIELLDEVDIALISVRRRALPKAQMEIVRNFVARGKPVVGIRTASHSFSLRGHKPPEGCSTWEEFDQEVFGGNYSNHHGTGPAVVIRTAEGMAEHPILQGVPVAELRGNGSLYKVSPLAGSTTTLLIGSIPDKPAEPVLWMNVTKSGGRVVYTSLGHPDDFKEPAFNRLLQNALLLGRRFASRPGITSREDTMRNKRFLLRTMFLSAVLGLAGSGWLFGAADVDPYDQSGVPLEKQPSDPNATKIVLVAGHRSHGPGEHEFFAGCALLMKMLQETRGVAPVMARDGWPKKPETFEGAKSVVFFMDGGNGHPIIDEKHKEHREVVRRTHGPGRRVRQLALRRGISQEPERSHPELVGGLLRNEFFDQPALEGRDQESAPASDHARRQAVHYQRRVVLQHPLQAGTGRRDADPQGHAARRQARYGGGPRTQGPRGDSGLGVRPRQRRPIVRLHGRPFPQKLGRRKFPSPGRQRDPVDGQARSAGGRRAGRDGPGGIES